MKVSIKTKGEKNLQKIFSKMIKEGKPRDIEVGYTANYALYVHEMVGANFQAPHAEAKFLEKALRRIKPEVGKLVKSNLARGASFGQSLYMVGLRVQRDSQKIAPIDTGHLKGSAYTREV